MTEPRKTPKEWCDMSWDEKFEDTDVRANYWISGGRSEPSKAHAVLNVEQAVNAWKNAAYAVKDALTAAQADNEKMRKLATPAEFTVEENRRLRAENERLRMALKQINMDYGYGKLEIFINEVLGRSAK